MNDFHSRANEKRLQCPGHSFAQYCDEGEEVTTRSKLRADARQIATDLHRSFGALLPESSDDHRAQRASLRRVLFCYVVRHTRLDNQVVYVQGMNFIAAMCLIRMDFHEEDAFWLLCFILEDIMDPMFFCYSPRAFLGYVATASLLKRRAAKTCRWTERIGAENFNAVMDLVLQKWLFTMFVNCLPADVLDVFWKEIVRTGSPRTWFSWTIGLLEYSERKIDENVVDVVDVFVAIRSTTMNLDDMSALTESIKAVQVELPAAGALQSELALAKQHFAYVDTTDSDNYLRTLAELTHFDASEIVQLEAEFVRLADIAAITKVDTFGTARERIDDDAYIGVDKDQFFSVVKHVSPTFPEDIVYALFDLLDEFNTANQLSFRELLVGMSILSRGTMDEKLRLAFDLFDTRRRGCLSLKEMSDLCSLLFRLECNKVRPCVYSDSETMETWSSRRSSVGERDVEGTDRGATSCRVPKGKVEQPLSRAFLTKLLMSTKGTQSGGSTPAGKPWHIIEYDGFRQAALSEPRLLDVFAWCLPRTPNTSEFVHLIPEDTRSKRSFCRVLKLTVSNVCSGLRSVFHLSRRTRKDSK